MKFPINIQASLRYGGFALLGGAVLLTIGYSTPRQWGQSRDCPTQAIQIYVAGEPSHVNLVVPVKTVVYDWQDFLPAAQIGKRPDSYQYLKFGWGDRAFYMNTPTWGNLQLTNALRALFAPHNPAALYVQGYVTLPNEPGVELKCVRISQADYRNLVTFLQHSFQQTSGGQPIRLQDGYTSTSGFYAATGNYSLLRTCNSWAAEGLESANVNTPLWPGLAGAVMQQLKNVCGCQSD
jgi:uncharacterized protein (TIGR02117 family)